MCWRGSAVLSRKCESGIQSCHRVQVCVCVFTVPFAEVSRGGSAVCVVCVCLGWSSKGAAKAKLLHNARTIAGEHRWQ